MARNGLEEAFVRSEGGALLLALLCVVHIFYSAHSQGKMVTRVAGLRSALQNAHD